MRIREIYQLRASWYRDMAIRASKHHATIMALSGNHGEPRELCLSEGAVVFPHELSDGTAYSFALNEEGIPLGYLKDEKFYPIDDGIAYGYLKQARLYESLSEKPVLGIFAYPFLEIADRGLENHA